MLRSFALVRQLCCLVNLHTLRQHAVRQRGGHPTGALGGMKLQEQDIGVDSARRTHAPDCRYVRFLDKHRRRATGEGLVFTLFILSSNEVGVPRAFFQCSILRASRCITGRWKKGSEMTRYSQNWIQKGWRLHECPDATCKRYSCGSYAGFLCVLLHTYLS